jgi:hypothetical protein
MRRIALPYRSVPGGSRKVGPDTWRRGDWLLTPVHLACAWLEVQLRLLGTLPEFVRRAYPGVAIVMRPNGRVWREW